MPQLKVKKLSESATIPSYATSGAACFDLHADLHQEEASQLLIGSDSIIGTGLAFEIPEGWQMLIFSRSGHGFKNDVRLANCVGVIDSDYRGEVKVKLSNDGRTAFPVKHGDRIAQAQLMPVHRARFVQAGTLSDTERGTGGFGSTGN